MMMRLARRAVAPVAAAAATRVTLAHACRSVAVPALHQQLQWQSLRQLTSRAACRFAAASTTSTPAAAAPTGSATPSSAGSAAPSASKTTADETTDAEAGLNRPVQKQPQQQQQPAPPVPAAAPAAEASSGGKGGGNGTGEDGAGEQQKKSGPLGPASWTSVVFLIVVGGGAVLYFRYQQDKQQNTIRIETIGTPLLGGPFSLIDDNGKRVTSESLKGKYVLLYFGFTYCPDICPTELKKMEQALQQYSSMVPQHPIVPVFISIDPRRDTPARMKAYKKDYMPQMLWLTGTDEEVSKVAKAYRVYYSAPDVDEGADDDYLVDHSIFFYLLDREGHFVEFFGKSKSAEEVAQRMAQLVVTDNK